MRMKYSNKLFCFSPPVMLATFIIEFSFAIYTLWRYKIDTVSRLAVSVLVALGVFQLAEYMVCGGLGLTNIDWARIGYVSITLLPALGIHMLSALAGKKNLALIGAAYATCAAFVVYYITNMGAISGPTCYANYAVFNTNHSIIQWFGAYYYGWLMIGTYLAWQWGIEKPKKRMALHSMMIGYLAFLLPTTTFNILDPTTLSGIPSIMCGFAVLLAFVITLRVLPASCSVRNSVQNVFEKLPTNLWGR
ncbi:hypothetical protein HGB25_00665 [Candidatus Saccharibacteria bacterium]|nr:hypothetical protein [Candidatus Saccharibacteria bacterium]